MTPPAGTSHVVETRATGSYDLRDGLTGVRGRYTLYNEIEQLIGQTLYVILADVDNFRLINDAYGENVGNLLLQQIGQAVQRQFGDEHIFRYGSDEFVIVRQFESEDDLLKQLQALRHCIAAIDYHGTPLNLTCSFGYVYGKLEESDDLHEAIRFADRKMYEAKRQGKDRAVGAPLKGDPFMRASHLHARTYKSYEEDELTGLANRVHFRNELAIMLDAHANDEDDPLTVVYFNVQNFKSYNEQFGYTAGDELLVLIGRAIENAYPGCVASRWSADQFMVATTRSAALPGVKKVREEFRKHLKDSSIWLKAGICTPDGSVEEAGVICDRAKLACDTIKGRKDVYFREYDEELKRQIATRQYVLDHFDEAIEKGYIKVYYQPIVHVATGEVCDEETLSRWEDPQRGFIYPNEFIPVLEEARLIHKLDLQVVRCACRDMRRRMDARREFATVSINLSRLDFELCDVVSEIEAILDEYRVPRKYVSVEVTESALTGNQEFLKDEIDRFRSDGFEVWMDDFGSGYSSLNLLKEYSFDLVKIDMGFLRGFEAGDDSRVLLANVINLAKELNLKTLVEGVETAEQLQFLKSVGCGRAQGYLFARPQSFQSVEACIAARNYPPIEPAAMRGFYSKIAHVNLQRPIPAGQVNGHYVPSDMPVALMMRRKGVYRYLNATDVCLKVLEMIGADSLEASERRLNDLARVEHNRFDECFEVSIEADDWAWTNYFESGKYVTLSMRVVAQDTETDSVAALVVFSNVEEGHNAARVGFTGIMHL